ncbi:hypothetical protein AS359_08380 [Comamonas kerstersii]|uniref:HNH nuclease domain-containing protein n=2 Tax=Comamonas kerstersii TaxID=225992 RepID=A0A0W7YV87_9BURK|nr:hypothetical protein AS359_08380 [Comamonas kerstersii]
MQIFYLDGFMKSFAFFFEKATLKKLKDLPGKQPIDYVGFADKKPCINFDKGDELFIVYIQEGKVNLAGRMIVGRGPMSRDKVVDETGRTDFIDKPMICLADEKLIDYYRFGNVIPEQVIAKLKLFNLDRSPTKTSTLLTEKPAAEVFRSCPRVSEESAQDLRNLLGLNENEVVDFDEFEDTSDLSEILTVDDDIYRKTLIKSRRGQNKFRKALLSAYKNCCVVTACRVESLLEAAHITPHAEHTDYRVSNGLLLRADIHTLFDLNLLCIDESYTILVSPLLKYSEYWKYNGNKMLRFPDSLVDQPNRDALALRARNLKKGEPKV